jgi:hypothetical protein
MSDDSLCHAAAAARSVAIPGHVQVQLAWGVAWVLALGNPSSGGDGNTTRVAVLPVQSRSTLPDSTRAELRGTIEQGLQRADVELVSDELVDGQIHGGSCKSAKCAVAVLEAVAAAWILRPTITVVDSVYEVRLEAIDGRGQPIASASERCEICGYGEVTELVADRSAALEAKVRLLRRQAPRLVLSSRPSGAEVWIDEQLVGHTPLEHEIRVGDHEVRVALPGYVSERRRITAMAGTQDSLSFTMLGEKPQRRPPWLGLGVASLATGTAMLGAGIALTMIDEREFQRPCNPDPLGHCSQRYDTLTGGIALAVGGGVLLATGVAFLIVDRRSRRKGSPSAARWRTGRGLAFAF